MKQKKNLRQIFSVFLTCMMIIGVALANDHIFVEGEGKPQAEQQVQEGEPQQGQEQEQEQGDPEKPGEQEQGQGEIQEGKPQQEPEQGQEPGQQEQGQGDSGKPGELPGKPEEVKQRGGQELTDVTITNFTVTNADGSVEPDGYFANQIFRLNFKWEVSNSGNALKEGDYFELDLPEEFYFNLGENYLNFDVKVKGSEDTLANAKITPKEPGGGKIRVTFTSKVNGYSQDGELELKAKWNETDYGVTDEKPYKIQSYGKSCTIILKPYKNKYRSIYKTAGQTLTKDGLVRWRMIVNGEQKNLTNVVITDTLEVADSGDPEGIKYDADKFVLYELVWDKSKKDFVEKNKLNLLNHDGRKIVLSNDNRTFTYNMGNLSGKAYILHYRSTYKQGLTLKNKVTLTANEFTPENPQVSYGRFEGNGNNGQGGSTRKIKIIKVDKDDENIKLKDAEFTIKKAGNNNNNNNPVIETKTTGQYGEAIFDKLEPGDYIIEETKAPKKYVKNTTKYTVTVKADGTVKYNGAVLQDNAITIRNEPVKTEIKVEKKWIGFEKSSIKAVLYADGVKMAEQELKSPDWKYTFKNLRKYDKNTGKKIIYTVDEEVVPTGYEKISITGSPEDGFVITNKQKTIDINGEKTWVDNNNAENKRPAKITVILYANGQSIQNHDVYPDANGKWTYSFEGLQEYDSQGNKITYTIKEEPVPGYISKVNGYDITNTYNPQNSGGGGSGGGGSGGGQSGGSSGGTGGDDSNKPKPNDPKPNDPTQNGPTPSDDSTGMGGATPPDGSVVPNDSTTSKNTVAPKNQKMPKSPVLTDKQGVKKTAQASRRLPKTGEGANPTLYAWMLGALGSMLVLVGYRKRKTVK